MEISTISFNKSTPKFQAGLTKQMISEIRHCDVAKISKEIESYGIRNDFKNNQTLAWCSSKCVELINELNNKFGLKLGLPNGIFVEEFSQLKDGNIKALAFCNILRSRVYPNSKKNSLEGTIFINENPFLIKNFWENIDEIANENYADGISATDFFLDTFIHEFIHAAHQDRILKRKGWVMGMIKLSEILDKSYLKQFKKCLGKLTSKHICQYAKENPMEAIACDLTEKIINSLDKDNLRIIKNPFKGTPYARVNCHRQMTLKPNEEDSTLLNKYLTNFWNGNFEI